MTLTTQIVRRHRGVAGSVGGQFANKQQPAPANNDPAPVFDNQVERFGAVFAVWFIAGLTDEHFEQFATLEFGNNLKTHIETLIETWETNTGCWCDDAADLTPDQARFCPVCLGVDINKPQPSAIDLIDSYDAMHTYQQQIHAAAFKTTFCVHNLDERLLNHPVVKGWAYDTAFDRAYSDMTSGLGIADSN